MNNQEKLKQIIDNLHEALTNITDANTLLSQSEKTKAYLEEYNKFENECHSKLDFEESNKLYETIAFYEQSFGIAAFLTGFQAGVKSERMIKDKDFVSKMLNMIM